MFIVSLLNLQNKRFINRALDDYPLAMTYKNDIPSAFLYIL